MTIESQIKNTTNLRQTIATLDALDRERPQVDDWATYETLAVVKLQLAAPTAVAALREAVGLVEELINALKFYSDNGSHFHAVGSDLEPVIESEKTIAITGYGTKARAALAQAEAAGFGS